MTNLWPIPGPQLVWFPPSSQGLSSLMAVAMPKLKQTIPSETVYAEMLQQRVEWMIRNSPNPAETLVLKAGLPRMDPEQAAVALVDLMMPTLRLAGLPTFPALATASRDPALIETFRAMTLETWHSLSEPTDPK